MASMEENPDLRLLRKKLEAKKKGLGSSNSIARSVEPTKQFSSVKVSKPKNTKVHHPSSWSELTEAQFDYRKMRAMLD